MILQELERSRRQVVKKLETMPVSMKTLASHRRKKDYEERIRGLEAAIEKYSDPELLYVEDESAPVQEDPEGEAQSTVND